MTLKTIARCPSSSWGSSMKRLAIALAAALLVTTMAGPADARMQHQCQAQWDQSCVHTGWGYGRSLLGCLDPDGAITEGSRCWKTDPWVRSNRIHGSELRTYTGNGWYTPNNHNSWKAYPAYFDNGWIYVQARCRNGNMGTTYMWAPHPHTGRFPAPGTAGATASTPSRALPGEIICPLN